MSRGPGKKPTRLTVLEGNPGHRPLPTNELEPTGIVIMPDYVTAMSLYAQEVWVRVVSSMPTGVYTTADTELVAQYATAAHLYKWASEVVSKEGLTVTSPQGAITVHPAVRIMKQAADTTRSHGTRLGLDPAARAAMATPTSKEADPFASLVGQSA